MASYLPSPEDAGVYQHPLFGIEVPTYLGSCPCGCGEPTVLYEDGSLCLPQTVILRDDPVGFMLNLAHAADVSVFASYLRRMRLDPAEFLLVRDELDLKRWSLLIGMAKPEVIALCLMAKHDRSRFEALALLDMSLQTQPPFSGAYQAMLNDLVGRYLEEIRERLLNAGTRRHLEMVADWLPLKLLYRRHAARLNLGNFFTLADHLDNDALSLAFTWLKKSALLLIHWAKYTPEELDRLVVPLGAIPDPDQLTSETGKIGNLNAILARALEEYLLAQQQQMTSTTLEPEYSDDDWKGLFNLK